MWGPGEVQPKASTQGLGEGASLVSIVWTDEWEPEGRKKVGCGNAAFILSGMGAI